MTIQLDSQSRQQNPASNSVNAVVTQKIEVAPGLAILRVVPDGWELPDFTPGQYAVLGLPVGAQRCLHSEPEHRDDPPDRLIKRAYSIASSSVAREYMEFYVALVPSGVLTPRLFALSNGDRLWLSPRVKGLFTLDEVPSDKHVALISTGTGLAPYMSMLRSRLVCGGERYFAVVHGARHSWDLGYRSELMTLHRMCSNFTYVSTISRPGEEAAPWTGASGYVQDLWKQRPLDDTWGFQPSSKDTHVFICGNPSMIESMVEILEAEGFREHTKKAPGQIHVERYW